MVGVPVISHILPSLEVIRALVEHGHRVTYANDPAVAGLIAGTGAEFVSYTSSLPVAGNAWPDDATTAMGLFLDNAIKMLPQLHAAYDRDRADLYLYDIFAYAARALAEAQGRPLLQLSPTFAAWSGYEHKLGAQSWRMPGVERHRARFAAWLAECGAATTDVDIFSSRPPRVLALIPRAMQPHADLVDAEAVTFVGPCLGARADQGGWTPPTGAGNLLLISLGSAFTRRPEFYRQCLAAYGDLPGWHVVLQIGKYTGLGELGNIPSNVEVHRWVPQLAILENADAFITHAGMGGSVEGLYTGTPMIAVPQGAEQFTNADRLVELGVARRLDTPDADATTLRITLADLVGDPEVARNAVRLRAEVRADGGTDQAVTLIENLLG